MYGWAWRGKRGREGFWEPEGCCISNCDSMSCHVIILTQAKRFVYSYNFYNPRINLWLWLWSVSAVLENDGALFCETFVLWHSPWLPCEFLLMSCLPNFGLEILNTLYICIIRMYIHCHCTCVTQNRKALFVNRGHGCMSKLSPVHTFTMGSNWYRP